MDYSTFADIDMTEAEIDEDAAAVLRSAAQAVEVILARRKKLDLEGRYSDPLVVVSGENHSAPAQNLYLMLLLKGLAESGERTVMGYELPHNPFEPIFKNDVNFYNNEIKMDNCSRNRLVQHSSGYKKLDFSDHSQTILFRYLQDQLQDKNPVRVTFTDVEKEGYYIDIEDSSSAHSMNKTLGSLLDYIMLASPEGLHVRNHHMAKITSCFAKEHHARIVVQHCGGFHVVGHELDGCLSEESLSACFKARNMPVLAMPVLSEHFNEDDLPFDHGLSEDELFFCRGVPDKIAKYDGNLYESGFFGRIRDYFAKKSGIDFPCRPAEALYINALLERTGLERDTMTAEEAEFYKKDEYDDFNAWKEGMQIDTASSSASVIANLCSPLFDSLRIP